MKNCEENNLGIKKYFYQLISRYLSVFIRPDNLPEDYLVLNGNSASRKVSRLAKMFFSMDNKK